MGFGCRADTMAWQHYPGPDGKTHLGPESRIGRNMPKTSDPLDGITKRLERAVVDKLYTTLGPVN